MVHILKQNHKHLFVLYEEDENTKEIGLTTGK